MIGEGGFIVDGNTLKNVRNNIVTRNLLILVSMVEILG